MTESSKNVALLEGYTIGHSLDVHGKGLVYELTDAKGISDRILKISSMDLYELDDRDEVTEGIVSWAAGDIDVGPKVYKRRLDTRDEEVTEYIVSERLSGPTMDKVYPYTSTQIKTALTLYHKLLKEDISGVELIAENILETLMRESERLLNSLTIDKYDDDFGNLWTIDNKKSRDEIRQAITAARDEWFFENFDVPLPKIFTK
jgi:hypothetical protein